MNTKDTTKYFTSFSALSYPVEPLNEIDLNAAQQLTTYYEARFNSRGLVSRFTKYLKQQEPEGCVGWKVMFTEEYEYHATGQLKERRLSTPDGELKVWDFEDKPAGWSNYFDAFASSLFSGISTRDAESTPVLPELALIDRLVVCHELMSELDNTVFETIARQPRTPDWILSSFCEQLPRWKDIIQLICPQSTPRVLYLAAQAESQHLDTLAGFDSIGGIVLIQDLLDPYLDRRIATPHQVVLNTSEDEDVKDWLAANDVVSLFVMPIRVKSDQQLEVAGLLTLALSKACYQKEVAAVASMLRRLGQLCHTTFDIAQAAEPIEERDTN